MKSWSVFLVLLVSTSFFSVSAQDSIPPDAISMEGVIFGGQELGGYYIGDTVDGVPEGQGTWYLEQVPLMTGEFRNGQPDGFLTLHRASGAYPTNIRDGAIVPNLYNFVLSGNPSDKIYLSLVAAVMGSDEATFEVESNENWYKIPGYNPRTAEQMRTSFGACYEGMYPAYGQYVDDIKNDIERAQRRSELTQLEAALKIAELLADDLTIQECVGRFALIMEGFDLKITEASLEEIDLFFTDLLDINRFFDEVALLMAMPSHQHVFQYGPWANEIDRAFLTDQLESMRNNDKTLNNTIDAWQGLQAGFANGQLMNIVLKYMKQIYADRANMYIAPLRRYDTFYQDAINEYINTRQSNTSACNEVSQCLSLGQTVSNLSN